MPTPQTAVVTPTRLLPQRLPYLQALHNSLKAQRDITWQWILSLDGASPDNIPVGITRDPRVKILPLPKCGAAMARNLAMNIVDAPTLVFSDDDDILTATSLAVRYEHLVASETASWVAG